MGIKNMSSTMEATVGWLQLLTEQIQTCSNKDGDRAGNYKRET